MLRFWNSDVDRNLTGVLEQIDCALKDADPTRLPLRAGHPPPAAEG